MLPFKGGEPSDPHNSSRRSRLRRSQVAIFSDQGIEWILVPFCSQFPNYPVKKLRSHGRNAKAMGSKLGLFPTEKSVTEENSWYSATFDDSPLKKVDRKPPEYVGLDL